jgi:tRNA (cmo5U34)-methyltransferase
MARVEKHNRPYHCDVRYLGLDVQPKFGQHWARLGNPGLNFEVCDLRKCEHFTDASLVFSLFTLQFIPEKDKLALLRKYRSGLVQGGALIIAEKVLADSGRMQDALTFPFYDHKMKSFRPKHILKKEKDLRGQMVCWYEQELVENLRAAGFRDIQQVWSNFPFVAKLALV